MQVTNYDKLISNILTLRSKKSAKVKEVLNRSILSACNHFDCLIICNPINKFALVWKLNDYKMYYNGSVLWSDTAAPVYPVGTLNNLDLKNQTTPFNGTMKDLRTYNTALTDAELITLTTL